MNMLLDSIGPAVLRASWQGAALAFLVVVLLRCAGERISPRWRYLLWSVVLVRLLIIVTPTSSWSVFNLVPGNSQNTAPMASAEFDDTVSPELDRVQPVVQRTPDQPATEIDPPLTATAAPDLSAGQGEPIPVSNRVIAEAATGVTSSRSWAIRGLPGIRMLSAVWLAGSLLFGLKLLTAAFVLRRRLSACRPVTDAAVLKLLETACLRIGLRRTPALLVTPESISPCLLGAWRPRIVVPESIVSESSSIWLRHILAHELAHLVRGDLWTNWLLLGARVVHWFNPVAWWTIREMQAEREAACDELALAALGDADHAAYAATIVDLATNLIPSALAPGMIGLFSSTQRLNARVERLVRRSTATKLRSPITAALLLGMAFLGLTDALPGARAQAPKDAASNAKSSTKSAGKATAKSAAVPKSKPDGAQAKSHTVSGRCFNDFDPTPLAGISVRLYKIEGRTSPPVEIARTVADAEGRFMFTGLVPPRPEGRFDILDYGVFGFAADRPIGVSFFHYREKEKVVDIRMAREQSTLTGRVIDSAGQPVAGATVLPYFVYDRPAPSLASATTDADGRFKLEDLGVNKWPDGKPVTTSFDVRHPNYPRKRGEASGLPADVVVTLHAGCLVTGTVFDVVTGKPAAGAVITAQRVDEWGESFVATDDAGGYRLMLPEGRYDFQAEAKARVCVAVTDRECLAGEKVELSEFKLIDGGFISGKVVNTATGELVTVTESGEPIMLGLYGPSQPAGRAISPVRLAAVDDTGRFVLRAAPGKNYPYFVNTRGVRMAWDTREQPAVVVNEGETTVYDMHITPPVPPEEKLKAAQQLVDSFSKQPAERTEQILVEFRKLNHTVDECELWCTLMRELVAVGKPAVPQLCAEMDQTTENVMLRRLAFALRAMGDPRAVPALIRAIPKTLLKASSDYGLIVNDRDLTTFMQTHDLGGRPRGGTYFDLGRPEREISGALHRLTRQVFNDSELFGISRSSDPRRQVLQRRLFVRQAERWQAWWDAHGREFTDDAAYQKVGLVVADDALPPASKTLGPQARLADGEGIGQAVLSPAIETGQFAWHFLDLDTGRQPKWPAQIPQDEAKIDWKKLADWAAESGADLMCITHRAQDGTETYVLRSFGVEAWEIGARDLRNIDKLIAAGTLPQGRDVGELLMHYDAQAEQLVPDANGAFIFITREGSLGLIETTDRVTRTQNLTGLAGSPPGGVGFHKGVRFNLKPIIP